MATFQHSGVSAALTTSVVDRWRAGRDWPFDVGPWPDWKVVQRLAVKVRSRSNVSRMMSCKS